MAEGGGRKVTPSVYKGSEEVFDSTCDPCSRLGNNSEAVDFCSDCSEYFCTACTTHHLNFGITSGHNVVKRDQAKQASQAKTSLGSLPTERCNDHNGERITTYCADHGIVACNTCVSMDHRSCDGVYYIPSVSSDPNTRRSVPRVQKEMSESLDTIKDTRQYLQRHKTMADDVKTKRLKHVTDRTERLIKQAREMEKAAVNDISKSHKETTDNIKTELASLDKTESNITTRMKSLGKADTTSDSQVFVDTKLGSREAKAARQLEHCLKTTGIGTVKTFLVDDRIDSCFTEIRSFGKVVVNKPYQFALSGTYAIGIKKAKFVNSMKDCCEMTDGNIIVTDFFNTCLKALDRSYKVVKTFKMPSQPWGICEPSQCEVAVTLTNDKKVQFVDIRGSWKLTASFSVGNRCRGIAVIGKELFVSCGGHPGWQGLEPEGPAFVGVYDLSGSPCRNIQLDSYDHHIFGVPYHIISSNHCRKIHIVDKQRGVITIDDYGNIQSTFAEQIKWANGVCFVDDANLLVSGKESNNVLQINTDGQLVAELLSQKDGIVNPTCVYYSQSRSELVVALNNSDKIKVFKLTS